MPRKPAPHPGEHIAEELRELHMSAAALSYQLKVPTNRITGILNGQRAITGDTALRLAERKAGKAIEALPALKRSKMALRQGASMSTSSAIWIVFPKTSPFS